MVTLSPRWQRRAFLLRYWVLDKYRERLRWWVFFAACVWTFGVATVVARTLYQHLQVDMVGGMPVVSVKADGGATIIIYLVIMVVSLAISYAMQPKTEPIKPREGHVPDVQDGMSIRRLYGTVWSDDAFMGAWKNKGTEAIKSGGSKKWKPGLLPGTTNPIESWLDDEWGISGLSDVDDPLGGGNHYPDETDEFDPDD